MLWSMQLGKGGISSLMLMVMGEVTSVFFNPWLAARDYRKLTKGQSTVISLFPCGDMAGDHRPR